jgi:acyl-CoA thioester hydrolase
MSLVAYAAVHEKRIDIRWRDLDAYAHVNQAVYLTYLEEIFDDWLRTVVGGLWHYVAAHVSIDYRAELRHEDRQAIGNVRLERAGTKSITARVEIRAPDRRLVAEAKLVVVARDPSTGASRALTDAERAAFQAAAEDGVASGIAPG